MEQRTHAFYNDQIKATSWDLVRLLFGRVVKISYGPEVSTYRWTKTDCGACLENNKWYRRWLR
ncbi:hypothetical protein LCGC14_2067320 [marine sediment metagenome]|uniref:Uncharacterized protein n=1 Tax=marine sediment metagenome TaxID=412755 RepID=A0A0F9F6S2_9ZZZZ